MTCEVDSDVISPFFSLDFIRFFSKLHSTVRATTLRRNTVVRLSDRWFFVYWGNTFRPYGVAIPAVFIAALGLSIMGVMGEFVLLDGANKVVEG